jgi:hypothetical protein
MNRSVVLVTVLCGVFSLLLAGCGTNVKARQRQEGSESGTGPEHSAVVPDVDAKHFKVDHPEQFPLVTAQEYIAAPGRLAFINPLATQQRVIV